MALRVVLEGFSERTSRAEERLHRAMNVLPLRMQQLEKESTAHRDLAVFPDSAALPESEHLLYQLGWAQRTFSYHFLLRTKDRYYLTNLHFLQSSDLKNSSRGFCRWSMRVFASGL